ncbi:MAG: lactate dehydrogenase [Ramlibacter sp.]|nr:lactate dehydrogenase [Ramlibacter sp.]
MKIGVIGAGAVGAACALAATMGACASEIVLVNRDRRRAEGVATDIRYGAALAGAVEIRDGGYGDLAGAALVMITAGVNEKAGGAIDRGDPAGRLKLLARNVEVYGEILPRLFRVAPQAVILVVTDPPDPLADLVRVFGFPHVMSTGTFLDSLRFRFHLARHLAVRVPAVEAQVLGEHGTSQVFLWSGARVAGVSVDNIPRESVEREVRFANIAIIEGTGASQYGIGMVCARIAEIVLRDERAVIPVGAFNPAYGVTISMPSVVGRTGVERILEPPMSAVEKQALRRSADTLRAAVERTL